MSKENGSNNGVKALLDEEQLEEAGTDENKTANVQLEEGTGDSNDINSEEQNFEELNLERSLIGDIEVNKLYESELSEELSASLMTSSDATKNYSTYDSMLDVTLVAGTKVNTKGYHKVGDGGGASYIVSKTQDIVSVKLKNDLYANLIIKDTMSPKQFGAVGDGIADDYEAFRQMAIAGVSTITIPDGIYNIGSQIIEFTKHINIVGSSRAGTVLKNVGIKAPYGISVKDLTCDGGGSDTIIVPGYKEYTTVMFEVTPNGTQSVDYINCSFLNTTFVSVACSDTAKFLSDIAVGCEFRNIKRAAIYHSCKSNHSEYHDNEFYDIGDKENPAYEDFVSAIWIGDVTNVNSTSVDDCTISNNKFYSLYSAYDDFDTKHGINASFLAIRADKAVIIGNYIENLYGYGNDREAIYTKVRDLVVDSNEIHNGGTGEGYICNKGAEGDYKCVVTNNNIVGEFGSGIRQYGTAKIIGNTITIDHCVNAINITERKNQVGTWPMDVSGNTVNCGAKEEYTYTDYSDRKYTVTNYSRGLVKIYNVINKLTVKGNIINPSSNYEAYIAIGNAMKDIIVDANVVNAHSRTGIGVSVFASDNVTPNLSQQLIIKYNKILLGSDQKSFNISFKQNNSCRVIEFRQNTTRFTEGGTKNYALNMSSVSDNNDTLKISGNSSNCDKSILFISTPSKTIINNDKEYATINKKK